MLAFLFYNSDRLELLQLDNKLWTETKQWPSSGAISPVMQLETMGMSTAYGCRKKLSMTGI